MIITFFQYTRKEEERPLWEFLAPSNIWGIPVPKTSVVKYISGSTQERGPRISIKNMMKKNLINVLIIYVKILIV